MAEKTDIIVYKEGRSMDRLGNYYILKQTAANRLIKAKYILLAEDFSYLNCNGDTYDVLVAFSESLAQLQLWAACNGFELSDEKPLTEIRRTVYFD